MANVFICQYFYFLYIPILYIFQKGRTAFADISVGGLKISRVPRVGDLAGAAGKLQQLIYFVLRVGTDDTQDIADVGVIHADDVIVGVIIGFFHLYGAVAGAGNVVFPEYGHGSMVNRVSDLLGAGGRGGDVEPEARPRVATMCFRVNSAMGERQMLPWQINKTFIISLKLL